MLSLVFYEMFYEMLPIVVFIQNYGHLIDVISKQCTDKSPA